MQALDTLDQARGYQFVQYNVTAPTGVGAGGTYTQTGALTGGATASDTGTITVAGPPSPACLTAAQVRGCWHFDELTGTTAIDSSGNANNGTYLNGVTLGVNGVFMTAIQLDGVNDVVRVPDSNSLDVGDDFSLEGWVKRSPSAATKTIEMFNKGGNGFQLAVGNAASGSKVFLRKANVTTVATSTTGVPADGNYHQVVATKSGNAVAFYIDGVLTGTTGVSLVQVIANTEPAAAVRRGRHRGRRVRRVRGLRPRADGPGGRRALRARHPGVARHSHRAAGHVAGGATGAPAGRETV